jgi:hypothetical protein
MTGDVYAKRDQRRYRRAVRRAFAQVTFYREQCAAAGQMLAEPTPTLADRLPQPPHTLCPFARPWSPEREPSLWTPALHPLARALRMAGCYDGAPVLEVRDALLDYVRLPRLHPFGSAIAYQVLLSPTAIVASDARRTELNREALALAESAGVGWVVGHPDELAATPEALNEHLRPVHRLPVSAVAAAATIEVPTLLYEPMLGYLGALVPQCRQFHLDIPRVYARERDGSVSISLPRSRRPTLLDIVPRGADLVMVDRCARHGAPTLTARHEG